MVSFPTKQTHPDLPSLFTHLATLPLPSPHFTPTSWHVLALATLTGGTEPSTAAPALYVFLTTDPSTAASYATPAQRQALVRRIRETLFKLVAILGIPKPLEGVLALDKAVAPPDRALGSQRFPAYPAALSDWTPAATHDRGESLLRQLYAQNLAPIDASLANHVDFRFLTREIVYGLFLSDMRELPALETELCVLSSLAVQNLPGESGWHMRGMRRLGVPREGVEEVVRAIKGVCGWMGVDVGLVGEVADIEAQVAIDEESA